MKLAGAYINDDKYERLVALAEGNNRTLAGQCRNLFDRALSGGLVVPDAAHPTPSPWNPLPDRTLPSENAFELWWEKRCADPSSHKLSLKEAMRDAWRARGEALKKKRKEGRADG